MRIIYISRFIIVTLFSTDGAQDAIHHPSNDDSDILIPGPTKDESGKGILVKESIGVLVKSLIFDELWIMVIL